MTGHPVVETDGRGGANNEPARAKYSLTESALSPFQAEPTRFCSLLASNLELLTSGIQCHPFVRYNVFYVSGRSQVKHKGNSTSSAMPDVKVILLWEKK